MRSGRTLTDCRSLQFGHGGDAVENAPTTPAAAKPGNLQFGHGGDAVENASRPRCAFRRRKRFNSATAVMPWKITSRSVKWRTASSFNSATAVMPWKIMT